MKSDNFTRHYIVRYLSARELVIPPSPQTVHFYQYCARQQNVTVMQIGILPALKLLPLSHFWIHSNLSHDNIILKELNMSTISKYNNIL